MTPRINIFLWLLATIAVAALTAWSVTHRLPPPRPVPDKLSHAEDPPSLHDWMHRQLDISPTQHAALDALETSYETGRIHLRQVIRQLGSELAAGMRDSAPEPVIMAIQEKLHEAQGQLQQATLRHFLEMKQHLTPAQAAKLAAWTHDSILQQPGT